MPRGVALPLVLFVVGCGTAAGARERSTPPPVVARAPVVASPSSAAASPVVAPVVAPIEGELPRRCDDMLLVPAGPFLMGAVSGGEADEQPRHEVTLPAFYLDETEVTNQAYAEAVAAGVCDPPLPGSATANGYGPDRHFRGPRQPVSSISWDNAHAYCAWRGKRLPSEAEWEKAARGSDERRYPWGDEPPNETLARYESQVTSDVGTHPAGAGPYGHLDLAGNVWEWVEDVYDPYAYRRPSAAEGHGGSCEQSLAAFDELRRRGQQGFTGSNPIPTECERVLRGGAFNYHPTGLRVTNRVHHPGRYRLVMSGFRCAKDP